MMLLKLLMILKTLVEINPKLKQEQSNWRAARGAHTPGVLSVLTVCVGVCPRLRDTERKAVAHSDSSVLITQAFVALNLLLPGHVFGGGQVPFPTMDSGLRGLECVEHSHRTMPSFIDSEVFVPCRRQRPSAVFSGLC